MQDTGARNLGTQGSLPRVLPMRERAEVIHRTVARRFEEVLPLAMREAGLDMWVLLCQEDDLDPAYATMIPMDTWCPILQILVFTDRGPDKGIERLSISGTDMRGLCEQPYRGQLEGEQWELFTKTVAERNPRNIGVNIGSVAWAGGGLTHNMYNQLLEHLPPGFGERVVSAEDAAIRWLSTLTAPEVDLMEHNVLLAKGIIGECFSREVIVPGYTTATDLVWHFWQRTADLGIGLSFRPYFRVVRSPQRWDELGRDDETIRPGDFLHCDVGIEYLRILTDHQQWAYVLQPGEQGAPAGAMRLLGEAHRLQDVFMAEFAEGRTGNEMLNAILTRARNEGIPDPRVYSHSLGYCLHEPGPLIGLPWEQERCVGRGDVRLKPGYAFTAELSVGDALPEWDGEHFRMSVEEDVIFDGSTCRMLGSRQREIYLV